MSSDLPFRKLRLGPRICSAEYNTLKFELEGATRGELHIVPYLLYRHTPFPTAYL